MSDNNKSKTYATGMRPRVTPSHEEDRARCPISGKNPSGPDLSGPTISGKMGLTNPFPPYG